MLGDHCNNTTHLLARREFTELRLVEYRYTLMNTEVADCLYVHGSASDATKSSQLPAKLW
jgi:hypothetical protein